jgi:hypothetical protein
MVRVLYMYHYEYREYQRAVQYRLHIYIKLVHTAYHFRGTVCVDCSCTEYSAPHKVDRVLGFFSRRPNWNPHSSCPPASVSPPPFGSGGTHSLAGEGVGGGPPLLLPPGECVPSPLWFRGGNTLACGRGDSGVKYGRGDRHCGALGIYVLCGAPPLLHAHQQIYFYLQSPPFQRMSAG